MASGEVRGRGETSCRVSHSVATVTTSLWLTLLSLLSRGIAPPTPSCNLYETAVGIVCFHGDEVTTAIAKGGTSWAVEFYSSWCGHCHHFAPTWRRLAEDIAGWSEVVRLGVIDCSDKSSHRTCSSYNIGGYPTIRLFYPNESDAKSSDKPFRGSRQIPDLKRAILDHLESLDGPRPAKWPHFTALKSDQLLKVPASSWLPVAVVFEKTESYLGKEVMMDLMSVSNLRVYRTNPDNKVLVNHYSIFEFPSLVIETQKGHHTVVPGHALEDPRSRFREVIREHIQKNLPSLSPPSSSSSSSPPSSSSPEDFSMEPYYFYRNSKVHWVDVIGAVSYVFRRDVALHVMVSGSAFTSLLRMTHLLESVFQWAYPAVAANLTALRVKLELRLAAGYITGRDWNRLLNTRLDPTLFPPNPEWRNCVGSQPHFRGYPCGLWMLVHTLTILSLPTKSSRSHHTPASFASPKLSFRSREALGVVSSFLQNFFSCEVCREHFRAMAATIPEGGMIYDGDAILWLWEAHNVVNRRLSDDVSSDPAHPKGLFPPHNICPYCYKLISSSPALSIPGKPNWRNTGFRSPTESFLARNISRSDRQLLYVWNRTAVLLFLWNYYHWNSTESSTRDILTAAWPRVIDSASYQRKYIEEQLRGAGLSSVDVGVCIVYYILCTGLLTVVGFWLLRRRLQHCRTFLRW